MAIGAILHYIDERPDLSKDDAFGLICLADWANDRGECWPSMATIAKRLRVTPRGAQKAIRRLADNGELLAVAGGGATTRSGSTNLYVLLSYRRKTGHDIPAEWLTTGELQDAPTGELQDTPTGELQDTPTGELQDTQNLSVDPVNRSSQIEPDQSDRQTDRDPQSPAGVCLSDTEKQNAAARREIIQAFQRIGVVVPSAHDSKLDAWVVAYPMPAILWAIREVKARRAAGERITSAFAYASKILENRATEGWPAEVLEDLRRSGYARPADVHDPTAGEFPEEAAQVADDPADDTAQAGGWSSDDVQADPGSELDQAWAGALAALGDRVPPVYVAALASCRLVDLNGRATVRAYDDMAAAAVQRMGRQIEAYFGVAGVDLAPAA